MRFCGFWVPLTPPPTITIYPVSFRFMYINSYHSNSKCVVLDHGGERANALRKKMDDENDIVVDLFVFPGATNPNLQWETLADILPCITSFMFDLKRFRSVDIFMWCLFFTSLNMIDHDTVTILFHPPPRRTQRRFTRMPPPHTRNQNENKIEDIVFRETVSYTFCYY